MFLGGLVGFYFPSSITYLSIVNETYISMFQVCSIPIIICAIIISINKFFNSNLGKTIPIFIIYSLIFSFVASILGIIIPLLGKSMLTPNEDTKALISRIAINSNSSISNFFNELNFFSPNNITNSNFSLFQDLLDKLTSNNIFESLANNYVLEIITFFIVVGLMLNFINKKYSKLIIRISIGIYDSLYKFIKFLLYFVSFSIFMTTAILFSISTSSVPLFAAASLLNIILGPLGIPTNVMSLLLVTMASTYSGISTFSGVCSSLAVTSIANSKFLKYKNVREIKANEI